MKPDISGWGQRPSSIMKSSLMTAEEVEAKEKRKTRNMRLQILALLGFLCNFIVWFDDPQLSSNQSLMLGIAFILYMVYMVNHNILHVLYVFTVYVSFQKVLAGDFGGSFTALNMTNILLVAMIGAWWSRSFMRGEHVFRFHAIDFFVIVYTILLTIALLRSEFIRQSDTTFLGMITNFKRITEVFFVYFLFANNIKSKEQIVNVIFCVCIVMGAVGFMGVKQYYMDIGAGSWSNMDKNKITILTDQPNQLASFLCNYSFYLLALAVAFWRKWWGIFALIAFMACFQSVRVTFSRGGILAFYAATFVCLVLIYRFKVIFVAIPIILIVMTFPEKVLGPRLHKTYVALTKTRQVHDPSKIAQQSGEQAIDNSAMSRLWIIQAGLTRIREDVTSAIFGVGLGLFPYEVSRRHPMVYWVDAHNQWLLILVECGSVALVVFLCIFAVCVWKAFRVYFRTKDPLYHAFAIGYLAGVTGLFVANFFGSRMNSNEIVHFHWIMTALLMRVDYLVDQEVLGRAIELRKKRRLALGFK